MLDLATLAYAFCQLPLTPFSHLSYISCHPGLCLHGGLRCDFQIANKEAPLLYGILANATKSISFPSKSTARA
jgi:hypothetical protein